MLWKHVIDSEHMCARVKDILAAQPMGMQFLHCQENKTVNVHMKGNSGKVFFI